MSTPETRIEKLKKLIEVATEDTATPNDLLKLTETLVDVIARERDKVLAKLDAHRADTDEALSLTLSSLTATEKRLRALISDVEKGSDKQSTKLEKRLAKELQRLERKIPRAANLSGIEAQIQAIQAALVTVPTEITANPQAVRDALELLSDDERLDIGAIRGLENYEELKELVKTVHPSNFNPGKVLRSLEVGEGLTLNTTNPNNPTITISVAELKALLGFSGFANFTVSATEPTDAQEGDVWVDIS